jgi:hypothetical protein
MDDFTEDYSQELLDEPREDEKVEPVMWEYI